MPSSSLPSATLEVLDNRSPVDRTASQRCLTGADQQVCPDCKAIVAIPHAHEARIIACPECGQCLAAPAPWSPALTEWGPVRPEWPLEDERKYPGQVGIVIGLSLGAFWFVGAIGIYLRTAAVMMGGALVVEGLTRLRQSSQRRKGARTAVCLSLPHSAPRSLREWSDLKAVFATRNSWLESLAICFVGLAVASGGAWLLDFMLQGVLHPRLVLAIVMAPAMLIYLLYRSVRNVTDRQTLLIFSEGLAYQKGKTVQAIPWPQVEGIQCENVGDAIDEQAVQVMRKAGRPPLRFTRCHFARLDLLWQRLLREGNAHAVHTLRDNQLSSS